MEYCLNCGAELIDKYCYHCGQEKITGRLSVKKIIKDVTNGLFHWESSILLTFKELLIRPGKLVRSYLDGKRKIYVKPFTYFIFLETIYVIFFHLVSEKYYASVGTSSISDPNRLQEIEQIKQIIATNFNYLNLLLPLIFAFFMKLFLRKKQGINYAESLVFSFYTFGTLLILRMVFMSLFFISSFFADIREYVQIIYLVFAFVPFSGFSKVKGIIYGLLICIISFIVNFISIIGFIAGYFYLVKHMIPPGLGLW